MDTELRTQIVVVGAGNAGLSAAVAARQRGAEVLVLEKAPREYRGGNSALTVHMLFAYDGVEEVKPLVGDLPPEVMRRMEERVTRYTKDMYYDNIMRVTEGQSDPELATILVERSTDTVQWMRGLGHLWAPTFDNPVSANVVSWEGGGHGMSTRWFEAFDRSRHGDVRHAGRGPAAGRPRARHRRAGAGAERLHEHLRRRGHHGGGQLRVERRDAGAVPGAAVGHGEAAGHALQHGRGLADGDEHRRAAERELVELPRVAAGRRATRLRLTRATTRRATSGVDTPTPSRSW